MKRYNIIAKPWDSYSADWDSVESPTGDWVRYEDAAAAQAELKLRVAKAIVTLSSAGYWSEFARLALKELRGG